jgi:signal transduction histidine kinase
LTPVTGTRLRLTLLALGALGFAWGIAHVALSLSSRHIDDRGLTAGLGLLVGWSFIGTGLFAWWRRPANHTGLLMTAAGFSWLATELSASNDDVLYTIGIFMDGFFAAVVGHLLVAFPTGRLETAAERVVAGAGYVTVTVLQLPSLLFEHPETPRNLLIVESNQHLSDRLDAMQYVVAVFVVAAAVVLIVRRWRRGGPAQRRALSPVLLTGGAAFASFMVAKGLDAAELPNGAVDWLTEMLVVTVPFGFLAGLLRTRLAQGEAVSELITRVGQAPGEAELRAALADALGDPSVALAYWLPGPGRFVDADGHPVRVGGPGWTTVELQGRRIAAIAHDPALAEEPQLVRAAGAAAALALENQRLSAELRARIEDLRASRARLVEATDAERRRLERDLHDGAQSRLVAVALKLQLARRRLEPGSPATELLDESSAELQASLDELRELARGIHPAVLTDRGLAPALEALADRAPVPVEVDVRAPGPLPPAIETAVYFVVAEALTNVAKYARARHAAVKVEQRDRAIAIEVADDGAGGADPARGSGLRGLEDRVGALDGRIELDSPPGGGTRVRAEIPVS